MRFAEFKTVEKKLVRELKWMAVSSLIVGLVLVSIYGIALFSQWRVDVNVRKVEAGQVEVVSYTSWK